MPWVKIGPNKYRSKSGKIWTLEQIKAFLATVKGKKEKLVLKG